MTKKGDAGSLDSTLVQSQGKDLFDRVCDYLTEKEWAYSTHADHQCLSFWLRLHDGNVRVVAETVQGDEWSRTLVYCTYPTFVPEPRRAAVAEATTRINYTTIFGNFEMDLRDGEVRVRTFVESDLFLGEDMIDRAFRTALDLANQYQSPILAISYGNASACDVLEMASNSSGATLQ
jgi:Putative bacterial sensory transduction regulator